MTVKRTKVSDIKDTPADTEEYVNTTLENILESQVNNQSILDTAHHRIFAIIERISYNFPRKGSDDSAQTDPSGLLGILSNNLNAEHQKILSLLEGVERLESLL